MIAGLCWLLAAAATDWAVRVDGVVGLCLWVVCGVSGARLTTLLEGSSSLDLEDLPLMIGCCWAGPAVVFVLLLLLAEIDLDDEEASLGKKRWWLRRA